MAKTIDYFNVAQVSKFSRERANQSFMALKDMIVEKGVKQPSAGYDLMEVAYQIRDNIVAQSFSEIDDVEKEILLNNLEYGLYSMAMKRFSQGVPLVLQSDEGFGPAKDLIHVINIGLDRFPGNTNYPMGTNNHYGIPDKEIRLSSTRERYRLISQGKKMHSQKIFYDYDGLYTQSEYAKLGRSTQYFGYKLDQEEEQYREEPQTQPQQIVPDSNIQ